jgi:putative transcriptional regulator
MEIEPVNKELGQKRVYYGGPVQTERGFVLHIPDGDWESTMPISDELAVTTSCDIIEDIANDKGPEKYLIALGYAGWEAGQLEYEISENAWLSGPANADIIFDTSYEKRWESAASVIGVDLNLLSGDMGHA